MTREPFLAEFVNFLKKPETALDAQKVPKNTHKLWFVLQAVSVAIVIAFCLSTLTSKITALLGYAQDDNYRVVAELSRLPVWFAFSFLVIVGPFLEELSFRMFLFPKKSTVFLGLSAFVFFLAQVILSLFSLSSSASLIVVFCSLICVLFVFIFLKKISEDHISAFFRQNFTKIVYSSSIIFALIHITNYQNYQSYWYLGFFLVLPVFFTALVLPFVRLKLGFWWGFLTHSLYNFVPGLAIFIFLLGPGKIPNLIIQKNFDTKVLSSSEKVYLGLSSMFVFAIYAVVVLIFISVVASYYRYKKSKSLS